jgi:DNA-binding protein H-NS
MYLSNITIQGVDADLQDTDVVLEAINTLKAALLDRAKTELAEIEQRRNSLLKLMGETPVPVPEDKPPRSRGSVNPPKYRNPDNPEQTWSGHGKRPKWVVDYLIEPANLLQDLLIP